MKAQAQTLLGETIDVLHMKGSGWDLATIEPAGHPAVRLAPLRALRALDAMTDEEMVNELRTNLLDASRPDARASRRCCTRSFRRASSTTPTPTRSSRSPISPTASASAAQSSARGSSGSPT